jgi:lipoyl(octanoyl) transferase
MPALTFENWGLIDYQTAWQRQRELQSAIQRGERDSTLVFCEHPTVITIGKEGGWHNIVLSAAELAERGVGVVEINRGGDVTLHAPAQLVGYPIFRLTDYKPDLHWFLREIEQCIIETIAAPSIGLKGSRYASYTGVWTEPVESAELLTPSTPYTLPRIPTRRKICAIGIHCSRWVTSHGFALNVANDLAEFDYIIPCGIENNDGSKGVTSVAREMALQAASKKGEQISKETSQSLSFEAVQAICRDVFFQHF